ncbi:tetratricopeptide repeat protein [Chromobacterium sphagni]|uniref:tetratricopeptide repeat protein n=1 Tax=Chromobacterium sphagni TaxID=1903179 RepID=UPI000A4EAA24|nr:tetratricopeptide repeat protein [Chromobacterium sphagni]
MARVVMRGYGLWSAAWFAAWANQAAALDLASMWNFDQPQASEQRFRAALATASPDEALILQTQIARSHGLRGDFAGARAILVAIAPQLPRAGAEAQVRYQLEWGRSWISATHPAALQTDAARAEARRAYLRALELARAAKLDALAVDALHMLAFVDAEPAAQLRWDRQALELALASGQAEARQWQASLRNNIGYALYQQRDYPAALAEFRQALALRQQGKDAAATRVAWWMVAWTLHAGGDDDEALAIQLRLERENDAAGDPDPDVFDELAKLYRAHGDSSRAEYYVRRRQEAADHVNH